MHKHVHLCIKITTVVPKLGRISCVPACPVVYINFLQIPSFNEREEIFYLLICK